MTLNIEFLMRHPVNKTFSLRMYNTKRDKLISNKLFILFEFLINFLYVYC